MKSRTLAMIAVLILLTYAGVGRLVRSIWEQGCTWYLTKDTPVYTPGRADEIALTLPEGTSCRVDESVGDTWQSIEYMSGGQTHTGMVLAESLSRRP